MRSTYEQSMAYIVAAGRKRTGPMLLLLMMKMMAKITASWARKILLNVCGKIDKQRCPWGPTQPKPNSKSPFKISSFFTVDATAPFDNEFHFRFFHFLPAVFLGVVLFQRKKYIALFRIIRRVCTFILDAIVIIFYYSSWWLERVTWFNISSQWVKKY